jgi:hypothetical protein
MERDYKITVLEEEGQMRDAMVKTGTTFFKTVVGCATGGPLGCVVSIGNGLKDLLEGIFGLSEEAKKVTIDDPDDPQGVDSWGITADEAYSQTAQNGAYAFYIEMPTHVSMQTMCTGMFWSCSSSMSVPLTMRVRLYFCLYREGTPESDIQKACSHYQQASLAE